MEHCKEVQPNQIVAYMPHDVHNIPYKLEFGIVKEQRGEDKAAVYYHSGDTAAMTELKDLYAIDNSKIIPEMVITHLRSLVGLEEG